MQESGMKNTVRIKNMGLRGVPVADTKISFIDGLKGILIYRGYRIEELAEKSSFVETAYLLLNGTLPRTKELEQFNAELVASRKLPDFILKSFRNWPKNAAPMDVLQASLPLLAMADPELMDETRDANVRKAIRIIARMPAILAGWHRIRNGLDPLPPDHALSHAANFLWQLHGRKPDVHMAKDLDVCMILHAEHTFNASTFACREVVSTRAHMYAGVSAGIGALSGSLHGGANAKVMEMLFQIEKEISSEDDIAKWVKQKMDRGEKMMGMGHAVYKTFDPRSIILKEICRRLAVETGHMKWYRWLSRIEEECHREFERKGKSWIKSNVDFYAGLLYAMMDIPVDLMTPMFALSIVTGWCSHVIEEKFAEAQEKPVLYRPEADYVGDYCGAMGCEYKSVDQRG